MSFIIIYHHYFHLLSFIIICYYVLLFFVISTISISNLFFLLLLIIVISCCYHLSCIIIHSYYLLLFVIVFLLSIIICYCYYFTNSSITTIATFTRSLELPADSAAPETGGPVQLALVVVGEAIVAAHRALSGRTLLSAATRLHAVHRQTHLQPLAARAGAHDTPTWRQGKCVC